MKIEYKILWLEDDASWIRVPKAQIEREIRSYGFEPIINTILDCNLEQMQYSDYDLILMDYNLNCGIGKYGNDILLLLRDRKIFADAIFYSSTDIDTLYDKIKEGKISNVQIFDRGVFKNENIDQIYEIITYYLKKELDLNSMRGIMMSELARFDNRIWEILIKIIDVKSLIPYVKCKSMVREQDLRKMPDDELLKKLLSNEDSTIYLTSSMRSKLLKNLIKIKTTQDETLKPYYEILKLFYKEIIDKRNALAHREIISEHDEEDFKLIRQNIIKHKNVLNELVNKL